MSDELRIMATKGNAVWFSNLLLLLWTNVRAKENSRSYKKVLSRVKETTVEREDML